MGIHFDFLKTHCTKVLFVLTPEFLGPPKMLCSGLAPHSPHPIFSPPSKFELSVLAGASTARTTLCHERLFPGRITLACWATGGGAHAGISGL